MLRIAMLRFVTFLGLVLAAFPASAQAPAHAAPVADAASLTPAQARAALSVLQDEGRRAALMGALQTIAGAPEAPASATPAPAAVPPPTPAATPPPAPADDSDKKIALAPDSLGAQVLARASQAAERASDQFVDTARTVTDFPLLARWLGHLAQNADTRASMLDAAWRMAVVVALALLLEYALAWLFRGLRQALAQHAPEGAIDPAEAAAEADGPAGPEEQAVLALAEAGATEPVPRPTHGRLRAAITMLRRLPYALAALVLDLVPLLGMAGLAYALVQTPLVGAEQARLAIIIVVIAYAVCRLVLALARAVLAPAMPRLRLVGMRDETAWFLLIWLRRVMLVGGTGWAVAEIGGEFGLYVAAQEALLRLTGLVVHLLLVVFVLRCRRPVAEWLRGARSGGALGALRGRLADIWHWPAIVFILGLWLVYAIELRNGLQALLHFLLVTVLVLGAARIVSILLFGALARLLRAETGPDHQGPVWQMRATRYVPLLRGVLNAAVALCALMVLLWAWGVGSFAWFGPGSLGGRVSLTAMQLLVAAGIAIGVWETANALLLAHLARLSAEGMPVRAMRLRTLLPMLRTTLLITILVIISLMTLSAVGIDIAPLLAGAGIIGVAIGFGSQKLVQDVITGMFLLLENAMQVGDTVTLAGLTGVVEYLSIRTIRLRAGDGSVHIIPFSSVGSVTNTNRGVGNAPVSVEVELDEDVERVCALLRELAAAMYAEPTWRRSMTGDLQLWGVDRVDAQGVAIVGQIPCTDAGRWAVQREFNRRLQLRVRDSGIRLARHAKDIVLRHPLDVHLDARALPERPDDAPAP